MITMNRKKILVIDFIYPLPENIGRSMRTMNFVRYFKQIGTVDLLYFYPKPKGSIDTGVFSKEYFVPHPTSEGYKEVKWHQKIMGRTERLLKKRPWMITEWSKKTTREYLSVISSGNYDIIFCRYILDTYPLFQLPENSRKRVVLDFDDVFSESLYGFYAKYDSKLTSKIKNEIQKYLLVNYERRCLQFGSCLFVTRRDQAYVTNGNGRYSTYVVPNIYPCNVAFDESLGSGYGNRNLFLFIGTLDYGPNVEGLKWFVENIFKRLSNETSGTKLLVVGRAPTNEVRKLCGAIPGIELSPDVPDVIPYYKNCGIVVVPILAGGGTRIKILESGMAGRPVLSTPMGANGLDVTHGKDLFLFSDFDTFMDCHRKLNDKDVYDGMVGSMKSLVQELYSPDSFNRKMEEVTRQIGQNS